MQKKNNPDQSSTRSDTVRPKRQLRIFPIVGLVIILSLLLLTPWKWVTWGILVTLAIYPLVKVIVFWKRYLSQRDEPIRRASMLKMIVTLMCLFFCSGAMLYLAALQYIGSDEPALFQTRPLFVNLEYLFHSMECSLRLFMFDIDGNIFDSIPDHQLLKGFISLQALLSFVSTLGLLIIILLSRARSYINLRYKTRISVKAPKLFLFFGADEPSLLLAADIRRVEGRDAVIVFIQQNRLSDDTGNTDGIIGYLTNRGRNSREIEQVDGRIELCSLSLSEVSGDSDDLLNGIDADLTIRLLSQLSSIPDSHDQADNAGNAAMRKRELHIFFLGDDEKKNVADVIALSRDRNIKELVKNGVETTMYCHARKNGPNSIVEDIVEEKVPDDKGNEDKHIEIRIVDSSALAIEQLKQTPELHPVELVELSEENPGAVTTPFSGLVIGFDEAGQDALGFLFEFGAFLDANSPDNRGVRSKFNCVAVDMRMKELSGRFMASRPELSKCKNTDGSPMVSLVDCDCRSDDFFKRIFTEKFVEDVNAVIITVGDDDLGIDIACRLFAYIRTRRADLSRLRILVRCYRSDNLDLMRRCAKHCNLGAGYGEDSVIRVFGSPSEIYTHAILIDDELLKKAKRFFKNYSAVENPAKKEISEDVLWEERREKVRNKNLPQLDKARELRRKESQDRANALHIPTKLKFFQKFVSPENKADFYGRYFMADDVVNREGKFDKIEYPGLNNEWEKRLILNLAKMEHLRWLASHIFMGYRPAPERQHGCDEHTRTHNCLIDWEAIDDESRASGNMCYKTYDYITVDTTFILDKTKVKNEHQQNI